MENLNQPTETKTNTIDSNDGNPETQPESNQNKPSIILTVKRIIIAILIGVIIFNVIKLFGGFTGVSGENIKYYSKSENAVYVYSVCPECKHVGDIWEAKISPGEDCSSMEICEACNHMFDIYVKRK